MVQPKTAAITFTEPELELLVLYASWRSRDSEIDANMWLSSLGVTEEYRELRHEADLWDSIKAKVHEAFASTHERKA